MIRALVLIAICLGVLAACEDNPAKQYGKGLTDSYSKAKVEGKAIDIDTIQRAVDTYHTSNERYPADLAEVSRLAGKELDPALYNYDSVTGKISAR